MTVTFHYLARWVNGPDDEKVTTPIQLSEFQAAMKQIAATPAIDTTNQDGVDKLRFGSTVPVFNFSEIESNLWFGSYKGVYTGHSYENTARGVIPHDSASLRTFYFIAYWSKPRGRVYIATQYLGQFGDYTGLKNTIMRAFADRKGLDSHSFRNVSTAFQKVTAKEIIVDYVRKAPNNGTANTFGRSATVVLKKTGDGSEFAEETRKKLFPFFNSSKDKIRAEVAKILKEDQLISVSDEDILNCTVIADVDGAERRYHFINESNVATGFPVSVGMTTEGHPEPTQLKTAMRNMLKNEILAKSENV